MKMMTMMFGAASALQLTPMMTSPAAALARAPIATMDIESSAMNCLDEECSVDTISTLIAELKAESADLSKKQNSVTMLINQLSKLVQNPEKNKNEIEKMVAAAARTFQVSKTDFEFPEEGLGYSLKPTSRKSNSKAMN